MDNISELYNKKPKLSIKYYLIFIIIIIILLIYSINTYTYDIKEILMINDCQIEGCSLKTTLNYEEQESIKKNAIISFNGEEYKITDIKYEEPYLSNGIPVTDISIETDIKTNEKILKIKLKYNKQRIIKKIIEKIIERK